jgi:hypothetical protein
MMLRVLKFEASGKSREYFPRLYQGFVLGGDRVPPPKGREIIHRERNVLLKLQAVSVVDKQKGRVLRPKAAQVQLEELEHELLTKYFWLAPWRTEMSIQIAAIGDWLSACPSVDA